MLRMKRLFLLVLTSVLLLSACGAEKFIQTSMPPKSAETVATLETTKGAIKIKFYPQFAPETVKNFLELSKKSFYNGLIFHRVIPNFMIQGGDPTGTGMGGETYLGPGTTLQAEISPELKHIRGALSMARRGNDINSATSQFFIVQNKDGADFLDGEYTIFGQVFEGMDAVDAIVNEKRDANDKPLVSQTIKSVTIESAK